MRAQSLGHVALVVATSACTVERERLDDKPCPCAEGYACDPWLNRCRSDLPAAGQIRLGELRADWTTPNTIRWSWVAEGAPDALQRYELVVGRSPADVMNGKNVELFTPDQNPELGRFNLPQTGIGDPVLFTLTDGREPDTEYFAGLFAYDTALRVSKSTNIASARTALPATQSIVIYADQVFPPGFVLPTCTESNASHTADGTALHYQLDVACSGTGPLCSGAASSSADCWVNLMFTELGVSLAAVKAGPFSRAWVEFSLAIESPIHSYYGEARLKFANTTFFTPALTFRADGSYRRYQLALDDFVDIQNAGEPIRAEQMLLPLDQFHVGARYVDGARIHVDEVRIRW